jgi:predicted AlkP superfamily pyrophosphatase or phosphodiesterase
MINQKSLEIVEQARFGEEFLKPLYESYCFSNIPETIASLFSEKKTTGLPHDVLLDPLRSYDTVILFLIDGFGWCFYEKYKDRFPFLKRIEKEGVVSKLTAQFPSTTAAHVTTLNTSKGIIENGVYEWFYYEPVVDEVICPLLYSFAGDRKVHSLLQKGIAPETIFPTATFYQSLAEKGINSYVFLSSSIFESVYSSTMMYGAERIGYSDFSNALDQVNELLKTKKEKKYIYVYLSDIDSAGHRHGIGSEQFEEAVLACFNDLEEKFTQASQDEEIACLLIADHGMVPVHPKSTYYLNVELPDLLDEMKKNNKGKVIAPCGSCRDFFLHIKDDRLQQVRDRLEEKLKNKAVIYKTEDLIERQYFSLQSSSDDFLRKTGNLVILPFVDQSIWWYDPPRFEQHFFAAHGGLSKQEIEIPFLFWEK